jgi:hypothetical protein
MKLSKSQQEELEVWEYFVPTNSPWLPKTDEDIKMFFEWSERGKHKDIASWNNFSYFEALRQGKRWAGIHWQMYEEGILEGTMPYSVILEEMPRAIVNQMKREMFKGIDADLIEKIYTDQNIFNS